MKTQHFVPLLLSLLLGACTGSKTSDGKSLNDCPEIATLQQVGNDKVMVVQLDKRHS